MAFSSSEELPSEGEDLSKGSSFNGVTGLRAREGKSRRLGERISELEGENLQISAELGFMKVLMMRVFFRLLL